MARVRVVEASDRLRHLRHNAGPLLGGGVLV